ncbi:MAG: 2'-5' RNA ligase family protein [Candidatus Aenigmatarchaeota archaeon]
MGEEYAVWFMPSGNVEKKLRENILTLSKEHKSYDFEPHVTLIAVKGVSEKHAIENTRKISKSIEPFKVSLNNVDYTDRFYQCIFVRCKKTRELMKSNRTAQNIFDTNNSYMPHLSLMYGNFPPSLKEKIIKKIGKKIDVVFEVDYIYLIRGESPNPKDWHIIKKFRL